jgi:hypothetical protein
MPNRKSTASAILFSGCALCFFLPFVTVSCQGAKVFTLTGQQLATGTTIKEPSPFGPPKEQKIDAHPFGAVAGLCALAGVILCLGGQKMSMGAAATGGAGALSLVVMKSQFADQLQKQGMGVAQLNTEIGYTLALLLFVSAGAWSLYLYLRSRKADVNDKIISFFKKAATTPFRAERLE